MKTISVFLSVATALTLSGAITPLAASAALTQAQINSIISLLESFGADSATVANVRTTLEGGTPTTPTTPAGYTFSTDLKLGSTGTDVLNLQKVLNSDSATQVASSGAGSPGNETSYFGSLTRAAVIKFQNKYASEVLTPIGLASGTGYVGSMTRTKLNALSGGTVGGVIVTPQGTGLTVTAGIQPVASIAPRSATRIPFTVVNFTASSDGDVTVNSIIVERTGLAADATLSGILLVDENGLQVGLEKTLNSVHQVTLSESFTVKAGQTKKMTIAANRASTGTHGGEIAYLSLIGVNTSATVNGVLPITGTGQTINETLEIGSITNARGPLDPTTTATKEVGTTGYIFSSIRITAGSAEKVRLLSIRWNQSGSAASSDLENAKTYIDGVAYDTSVSSDGKYYTSTFGSGIVIDKGFSKEIYVKGDIVGGSARTIDFDIYKRTDLYLKGETYGYGILGATDGAGFGTGQPWYNASYVTVSAGTLRVAKATSIDAQNIAINLANEPLGGFEVEARGEPISVGQMVFTAASTTGSGYGLLTSVSLYDENGSVIAGPVDGVYSSALEQTLTFTDTVTFPIGKHVYTLKGKVASTIGSNGTYIVSTTPSTSATAASNWTTVRGQTTGVTIYPTPYTAVAASTMTVKAGDLAVSVSSVPLARYAIAGTNQFLFANYVLDAGGSGEDVSLNSMLVSYNVEGGAAANAQLLTSCTMNDGATAITAGGNVKNPTEAASSTTFVFDSPLVITKGTSKTVGLKCNVAGSADGQIWRWGYNATDNIALAPVGRTSGQTITERGTTDIGRAMTAATGGAYTVVDDSTPGYSFVQAGATGVTLLKLKFSGTTEAVDIHRVNFELATPDGNDPKDLVSQRVNLYDESANLLGYAEFSTSDYATSTLIAVGSFRIPAGGSKTMLVKGDIAAISHYSGPLQASGDLLKVAYDGNSNGLANGNYGKGVSSGTTLTPSSSDVTPSGVRIIKAYPSLAKVELLSGERTLYTHSNANLYKFSITASNGDVHLYKLTFKVSSSTGSVSAATTTNFAVYAYTDSGFSVLDTTHNSLGKMNYDSVASTNVTGFTSNSIEIFAAKTTYATSTYKVPSGTTRYLAFQADISNVESVSGSEYITVQLQGDAAVPSTACMQTAVLTDGDTNDDFIWSPNSTSSSILIGDVDFTNGYSLTGLPSTNMGAETIQSSAY